MMNRALFNLPPLSKNDLAALPLTAIRPEGWLKEQLQTAAKGLTGKLVEFWPDVKNSAWRGGDGDGWERAPYYLDGLVPLAWMLDDERLKGICMEYIEWTLASQREDGFFGPESNDDWWPRMVMLKVMISYFTATVDKRVPEFMYNYFRYEYLHIDEKPLREWAVARGGDNMLSVIWLYNLTGGRHQFLLKLLDKLRAQTLDWTGHFAAFPYTRTLARLIPWEEMRQGKAEEGERGEILTGLTRPHYGTQYHLSHVVNVAMGLKTPGVISQFKTGQKELEGFKNGFSKLMKFHGVAMGMFTGDEHLSGNAPTQGTELCAVVELMFTVETLLSCGVDTQGLGDILEKLAFNALPAAISPDMMSHQYDQQVNQVRASSEKRPWYNNNQDSNLFGLEPNYGCCTANMHQGWPKYAMSLWYATGDGGFAAVSYAPCRVGFQAGGAPVKIAVEGEYPFSDTVTIHIDPAVEARFPIRLRIPAWAEDAVVCVNGGEEAHPAAGDWHIIDRAWAKGDVITLRLPMKPRMTRWSRQSGAIELGPLLMALHPKENWQVVKEHPVAPDYQITAEDNMSYALVDGGNAEAQMTDRKACFGKGEGPFVTVDAVSVPEWKTNGANADATPLGLRCKAGDVEKITLTPYGDTCLRIGQFPVAEKSEE